MYKSSIYFFIYVGVLIFACIYIGKLLICSVGHERRSIWKSTPSVRCFLFIFFYELTEKESFLTALAAVNALSYLSCSRGTVLFFEYSLFHKLKINDR